MPPITILKVVSHPDGGWDVKFRDEANLDGLPLEASWHLTPARLRELADIEDRDSSPLAGWLRVAADYTGKGRTLPQPVEQVFAAAYGAIVQRHIEQGAGHDLRP